MLVSDCAICGKEKSRFIKNQEKSGLLSKLKFRTPLSNTQLFGDIVFKCKKQFLFVLMIFEIISLK